ncbi:hypothetical protein OS125_11240 [Corynebacterium sp. P7003]|uniref:Uncharacterized protein n=1 Tax=Corynebacterium pygosceleis TaxID=2800406 RepID=A0ABT3WUH0_9CORY|nr:hypothetical protein [Corynebacterium pygosceleis]MCX7445806.1 hypothetical protein [Corynebacterium pygosceleis]
MYAIYTTGTPRCYTGPNFGADIETLAHDLIDEAGDRGSMLNDEGGDLEALFRMVYPLDESELDDDETNPPAPQVTPDLLIRAAAVIWDEHEKFIVVDDDYRGKVHATIAEVETEIRTRLGGEADDYNVGRIADASHTYVRSLSGYVDSTIAQDRFAKICEQCRYDD